MIWRVARLRARHGARMRSAQIAGAVDSGAVRRAMLSAGSDEGGCSRRGLSERSEKFSERAHLRREVEQRADRRGLGGVVGGAAVGGVAIEGNEVLVGASGK